MSYYALTDTDWPWDDEHEGRAIVVEAECAQDAVKKATEKHLAEFPGAGGITWKVAQLADIGCQGVDWEDDNKPVFDGFTYYGESEAHAAI